MNNLKLDPVSLYPLKDMAHGVIKGSQQTDSKISSFGNVLQEKISKVNDLQREADKLTQGFMAGQPLELHDVMLSMEKADLALQLTVQLRNKVVEAYKEVSQMQI